MPRQKPRSTCVRREAIVEIGVRGGADDFGLIRLLTGTGRLAPPD
ncbi:hypothetical protein ACIRL2_08845 [Embleya sp. NPDC127516]